MNERCKACGAGFGGLILDECEECHKKICPDCDYCGCMGGEYEEIEDEFDAPEIDFDEDEED